jgi:hypothetical protein
LTTNSGFIIAWRPGTTWAIRRAPVDLRAAVCSARLLEQPVIVGNPALEVAVVIGDRGGEVVLAALTLLEVKGTEGKRSGVGRLEALRGDRLAWRIGEGPQLLDFEEAGSGEALALWFHEPRHPVLAKALQERRIGGRVAGLDNSRPQPDAFVEESRRQRFLDRSAVVLGDPRHERRFAEKVRRGDYGLGHWI